MSHVRRLLVLHIGTMKSGTTYLQRVLTSLVADLESHGWTYPVGAAAKRGINYNHEAAMFGLLGPRIPWVTEERAERLFPRWVALKHAIEASRGRVLLSSECLAALDLDGIRHLIGHLDSSDVRVVVTLRDLGRVIPSSWQQHVRNARLTQFEEYIGSISAARSGGHGHPEGENFWRSYRLDALVDRWSQAIGRERIVLVTSPRMGAQEILWERFLDGCGAPERLARMAPRLDDLEAHRSVTWPVAVALQRLVRQWDAGGMPNSQARTLLPAVVRRVASSAFGEPIRLPARWIAPVREWAEHDVSATRSSGARLVGEWGDLLLADKHDAGSEPSDEAIEWAWSLVREASLNP